jgi:hypothetical protein
MIGPELFAKALQYAEAAERRGAEFSTPREMAIMWATLAEVAATIEAGYANSVNPIPSRWANVLRPGGEQATG